MGADGFDVVISNGTEIEIMNEVKYLNNFLHSLNPMYDVRFVLNINSNTKNMTTRKLKALMRNPPSMIRLDAEFDQEGDLDQNLADIREFVGTPVKVSSGVTYDMIHKHKSSVKAFDVSYKNALKVVKDALQERTNPKNLVNKGSINTATDDKN